MFPGLRKGSYQLVVPIDAGAAAALAEHDIAYGGPGVGYAFALEVGERKTQAIPFDITHTTINVAVTLKGGEYRGDPIPGASVTLYATAAGGNEVGSGATEASEAGVYTSIKVARAGTSDNTVYMGVAADGYFVDPAAEMQAVTWDPQSFVHPAADANPPAVLNDANIVNLNVNVNINGATVDRGDYGGGEALAGWAISVMSGDAAVPGAPTALGSDGSVAFTTTVASVPATFTFAAAEDQEDELDGGEMYESSGGMYTHTGLKLAGTAMDADPIVVTYTSQTLEVYVHHERDQVRGYTGNALDGDDRTLEELVNIEVRRVGDDGLTRSLPSQRWSARENTTHSRGVYTFSHLPAEMDIVVQADAKDGYMLLDHRQLATYRDIGGNGVMGGAFGDMGGWGHTVRLCPLTEIEPTGQDFGTCASFAVVMTHDVHAMVSKKSVRKSGDDFGAPSDGPVKDITVKLEPVEGKNLAGDGRSFTTTSSDDPTTDINEKEEHQFVSMAAGTYTIGVTDGWRGMVRGSDTEADVALSPLAADLDLDITPSTATVYGKVTAQDNFGLENVTVTVNGMTATTDNKGRYIVTGIPDVRGQLFVNTDRAGYPDTKPDSTNNATTDIPAFEANMALRHNISLRGANNTVTITGVVTEAGSGGQGIKGVEIKVDYSGDGSGTPVAPLNVKGGKVVTEDDGTYIAVVRAQPTSNPLVHVSASKKDYHFLPGEYPVSALAGSTGGTANFEGRMAGGIFGRVVAPGTDNTPMSDVVVTASWTGGGSPGSKSATTTASGTFNIPVPTLAGSVEVTAAPLTGYDPADYATAAFNRLRNAERYVWFDPPAHRPDSEIIVIPGQSLDFGTFMGRSVQPRITKVERVRIGDNYEGENGGDPLTINPTIAERDFTLVRGEPTDTIEVTWKYETRNSWRTAVTTPSGSRLPYAALDRHDGDPAVQVGTPLVADVAADNNAPTLETKGRTFAAVNDARTDDVSTPASSNGRGSAANGTTAFHTRTTTYVLDHDDADGTDLADYGEIDLRIGHVVMDSDTIMRGGVEESTNGVPDPTARDDSDPATDVWDDLAAVDASISGLAVKHVHDHEANNDTYDDDITVTWFGAGSPSLEHRIALFVPVKDDPTQSDWEWVVFDSGNQTGDGDDTPISRQNLVLRDVSTQRTGPENWGKWTWTFQLNDPLNVDGDAAAAADQVGEWYSDDGNTARYHLNMDQLTKATRVRVDTRVNIQVTGVDGPDTDDVIGDSGTDYTVHTYSGSGWMKQNEAAIPAPTRTP